MFSDIKSFLFDLDSTLIDTHGVFVEKIEALAADVAEKREIKAEDVRKRIFDLSNVAYRKYSIDPDPHWNLVLTEMQKEYELTDSDVESGRALLYEIYHTVPKIFDGTPELLEFVRGTFDSIALVTHADRDWTVFKLESTGLSEFFDKIHIVDVREYKGKEHWLEAAERFSMQKESSCVVGDSLGGDIIPTYESGFSKQVFIETEVRWSAHSDLTVPDSVITVKGPRELLELVSKA